MRISFFIAVIIFMQSCDPRQELIKKCDAALTLSLEKNIKFRSFSYDPIGIFSDNVKSNIFVIPLSKEVIDAIVNDKSAKEGLSNSEILKARQNTYERFLNPKRTTFALIAINGKLESDDSVFFSDFSSNVTLKYESGEVYKVNQFTRSLAEPLNPGFNCGYIYFDCSIPNNLNSYSIHFEQMNLTCGSNNSQVKFNFPFDQSYIDFLSVLQKGKTIEDVRNLYSIQAYTETGISTEDFLAIIKFLFDTVSQFIA